MNLRFPVRSRRVVLSAATAAFCGFAWMYGYWGPILSLALIPLVLIQNRRWSRYLVALAYYLAGSSGIPQASAVFFGPGHAGGSGHWLEGIFLWLASSALLAVGWAFADRPWKAATVLLFDALIPPLAFFDWMSPLSAAGVLFPGTAILGVILLLAFIAGVPWLARWNHGNPIAYFLAVAVFCNVFAPVFLSHPKNSEHWRGLDTHLGPSTHSIVQNYTRMADWVAATDQHPYPKVILLPETLLTWWQGNADYVQQHVLPGQTWLVGASIPLKRGVFADGIEAVTDHGSKMIFASVLPVPVSMWHPWQKPSGDAYGQNAYRAFWWQKPVEIDGKSTWAEICYDQLLPFSWMEASLYTPRIVLLTNNVWWARRTGIPTIQRASAWAWSRLIGSTDIEAENQ